MKRIGTMTALVVFAAAGMVAGWHRFATAAIPAGAEQVVHMTAKRFEYTPSEITLKKGVPVILEITALDRDHGFKVPEFGIRADLKQGEVTRVRIVPDHTGRFEFRCDVFCGDGHEDMAGEIVVVD
jgi:cytochrome c oxidase subunit 2